MNTQVYIQTVFLPEIQQILKENSVKELYQFLLKNDTHPHKMLIAEQIEGKSKAIDKLPTWTKTEGIVFPSRLSMEQCSSEDTSQFKAELCEGETLLDMTGGYGVDSKAFASKLKHVTYVEAQEFLFDIVSHNFKQFGINNLTLVNQDSIEFLKSSNQNFDCIYLDPARRLETQKVFKLSDCEPNVESILPLLWSKTNQIIIKCSPLLDIDLAVKSLGNVEKVIVLAKENECKELLFSLKKDYSGDVTVKTVNLLKNKEKELFEYVKSAEQTALVSFGLPSEYLYEPNAAIMKSGAFKSLSVNLNTPKLHPNSHLYTSLSLIENFPGRKFKIVKSTPFSQKQVKKMNLVPKANISTRNFPMSTDEVRKLTQIKDGGDVFLFFTTLLDGTMVAIQCSKVDE